MDEQKRLKDREKRLWCSYRWTLAMVDDLFRIQKGKCAVCSRKLDGYNVDHEHFKIESHRTGLLGNNKWQATVVFQNGSSITLCRATKTAAENDIKNKALPFSVRGLLCPGRHGKAGHGCCNRLLGRVDNQVWLRAAADYLDNPPAKKILLDKTPTI